MVRTPGAGVKSVGAGGAYALTLDRNCLNPRTKVRWLPFKKSLGDWHMVPCESKGRVRVRERQSAVAVRGVINADF
jgi:hypothetical protein